MKLSKEEKGLLFVSLISTIASCDVIVQVVIHSEKPTIYQIIIILSTMFNIYYFISVKKKNNKNR